MIEARGLTKRFGSLTAVDHLDLSVRDRGIVGLLGPNGAGKTTTLRMLTGYASMTEGSAVVAGFDVFQQPMEVKARVGYLPETPPLYDALTIGEYLRFVAELRGVERTRRLARVGAVMERVGLAGFEKRLVGTQSKGYRQRIGLAQALVHDPPVIILDEPTSGLDPGQRVGIHRLITELAEERTVVLSTHLLDEVERLCEKVAILAHGRLVGHGTIPELALAQGMAPWLELAVSGGGADVLARLAALPDVARIESLGATREFERFRVEGDGQMAPSVLAYCRDAGWVVHRAIPHPVTLEAVFLAAVGGQA